MAVIDDTSPTYARLPPTLPLPPTPAATVDTLQQADAITAYRSIEEMTPRQQAQLQDDVDAMPAAERDALLNELATKLEPEHLMGMEAVFGRDAVRAAVQAHGSAFVREGYAALAGTTVPEASTPTRNAGDATTPEAAVEAIQALPLPDYSGFGPLAYRMSRPDFEAFHGQRNELFNHTRAQLAQDALDRMRPQRDDFAPPGAGHVGELDYKDAMRGVNADPYVRELNRIITEVDASPTTIPSYLADAPGTGGSRTYAEDEMRGILASVGIDIPIDATPADIADGFALLDTMPNDLLAVLANPGTEVRFTAGANLSIPGRFSPTQGMQVESRAQLSEVQVGADFGQTQQFRISVSARSQEGVEYAPTMVDKIRKWADRANRHTDFAGVVDRSPMLRDLIKGGSKAVPVSGSYAEYSGHRLEYETVMTPEQGALLDAGDASAAPNPLAPLDMPTGTSVLIRAQQFEGSELEVNFKAITIGSSTTDLSGTGFGVRRGEGSMVEVYAGPIDTVERTAFLGVGRQGVASLGVGSDSRTESQEMSIARIDLATSSGRAAYQAFMSTGKVPAWTPPGVPQSGNMRVHGREDTLALSAELGSLGGSFVHEQVSNAVETRWQDGSGEIVFTSGSPGGNFTQVNTPIDADGNTRDDQTTWRFVMSDVSAGDASYYHAAYGTPEEPDQAQHLQLTFSNAELMAMRDQAREYLDHRVAGGTYEQVQDGKETTFNVLEQVAFAETPNDVFGILTGHVTGTYGFYGLGVELNGMSPLLHHLGVTEQPTPPGSLQFVEAG